jgi:hypothetical protein
VVEETVVKIWKVIEWTVFAIFAIGWYALLALCIWNGCAAAL